MYMSKKTITDFSAGVGQLFDIFGDTSTRRLQQIVPKNDIEGLQRDWQNVGE
jgi:hypothetical protein